MTTTNEKNWHPGRTCLGCRNKGNKEEMIRIVRTADGHPEVDPLQRKNGRGAYICRSSECLKKAVRSGSIQRSLKVKLTDSLKQELQEAVNDRKGTGS